MPSTLTASLTNWALRPQPHRGPRASLGEGVLAKGPTTHGVTRVPMVEATVWMRLAKANRVLKGTSPKGESMGTGTIRAPREEARVLRCVTIVGTQGILPEIARIPKEAKGRGARVSPQEVKVKA